MSEEKINYNLVKNQLSSKSDVDFDKEIYDKKEVNMKDFVIGAFVGGVIGAAVGLLLAPKTGKDLRSDVATQAVNLKDKGIQLSEVAKEKTIRLSHQIKEQSSQIVEKIKTSNIPKVYDDGTVSSEGEEPLEESSNNEFDITEVARPSSIE